MSEKGLENLFQKLDLDPENESFLRELSRERGSWKERKNHRDMVHALENFLQKPLQAKHFDPSQSAVEIGKEDELSAQDKEAVIAMAERLVPWKKGPFDIFGEYLDAEWRSDYKWDRISSALSSSFEGKKVLDIGCNNGYFMFRALEKNPDMVLGIDPVVPNWAQFRFLNHLANEPRLFFQFWGVEHVKWMPQTFDVILSMGIIYHHRNPIQQLLEMKRSLVPGGEILLETIGIPGKESYALFPEDRYAKMRNVWFVPTTDCFLNWIKRAKFKDVELIEVSELTSDEQRLTKWCPPPRESLEDFLDPHDRTKTLEGYPAPIRIAAKARRHPNDKQD